MPKDRDYTSASPQTTAPTTDTASNAAVSNGGANGSANGSSSGGAATPPAISLPKGGGAIRGIGEKFSANPVTGTGSLSVPLPLSPGRSNFGPELQLGYDSGSGNGPFGIGWSLSLPAITRKTDKGLPQYLDHDESDVFILSGAEDLVPVLEETPGGWVRQILPNRNVNGEEFSIQRYRPRVEGLFSRIERWTSLQSGESHWRSITRGNVTTLYGTTDNSRIFTTVEGDPQQAKQIYSWLISESFDDKGNAVVYEYAEETDDNVDLSLVNERNRSRTANRYIKRIRYGNRTSRLVQPDLSLNQWLFELVFDYDEDHYEVLPLDPNVPNNAQHQFVRAASESGVPWTVRPDPFSAHRSGFEVRTYRRCRRALMFHRFDELGPEPYLVRSLEFDYDDLDYTQPTTIETELNHQGSTRFASFIGAIHQSGYVRDDASPVVQRNGINYFTYLRKSLPPLEFEYSQPVIDDVIHELDESSVENLPIGIDGASYQFADLDGEGISGVLTEQASNWFYKPNLGNGQFGEIQVLETKPSLANLNGGQQQLLDLAGDGQLDLVQFRPQTPGFYERTTDEEWEPFRPFNARLNIAWDEPNLRFVDLNGDGHADVLITEHDAITWYPSLAEEGFGSARRVRKSLDEEKGPRLVLADGTQSIYLADMCGDGLTDLVRVRNGEVCYWPNLGYGRFGAKVTMDNAPQFDRPDQFNQKRIRLADIDGSGVTDIIYFDNKHGARVYFNQSGNRWSDARVIAQFPKLDSVSSVTTADLLGNGTTCLIWSTSLPAHSRRPVRYIDLMSGQKPHLLTKIFNNLGAETTIQYAPSTKFYLADKAAGTPWITRISFPVHVVERIITEDRLSKNRFVTRHAYHHGYFDGIEREFRGFGRVDQWDTEEFASLNASQELSPATNIDEASHVPPILTRTWFHTGVYLGRDRVSRFFAGLLDGSDVGEYYREPGVTDAQAAQLLLDDTVLPPGLTVAEEREAARALKGQMLRQEVYALDATTREIHPYTVSEKNFTIEVVQAQGQNRNAVFFTHPREVLNYHYERDPDDPRVDHSLTLEVDEFGNVLKAASINYGRRTPDAGLELRDQAKQRLLITYTESDFTNAIDADDDYRTRMPAETRTFEITSLTLAPGRIRFNPDDILIAGPGAATIAYEVTPTNGILQRRLIEHVRTLYRRNNLNGALLPGQLESLALPFEVYKQAFTPGLITSVYGTRVTDAMLEDDGRYVHSGDLNWWIPSGQVFYSLNPADPPATELAHAQANFFMPHRYRTQFHTNLVSTETIVNYDAYHLLPLETRDPLDNRTTAGERDGAGNITSQGNDYRVLQPAVVMDANRNRTMAAFDALGLLVGRAVMGKPAPATVEGDSLAGFTVDLTEAQVLARLANPLAAPATLLVNATERTIYDVFAYHRTKTQPEPQCAVSYTLRRETHVSDPVPSGGLRFQHGFTYSDGFGREIQKKGQAEPGPVPQRDPDGNIIVGPTGQPVMTAGDVSPRWVGTGWTVFNNKGKAVRQFEPFFTDTHLFEFDVRIGVSPVLFYDPVGRVAGTLHPNHTWEKVVFDPWRQDTWDVNDTVLIADPRLDPDVGNFFSRLENAEFLPTWHTQRQGGALGPQEQSAAAKAAIHANTPQVAHSDSLGRSFLTITHNKFKYSNTLPADPPVEQLQFNRLDLDLEGNQRNVFDALDRVAMRYGYDMLGNRIHQASMEAGERWMLNDVTGKPLFVFDSRDHRLRTTYDAMRRPADTLLTEGVAPEIVIGRTIYGESQPNPENANLRLQPFQVSDQAGTITSDLYSFKGNRLRVRRQLAVAYATNLNWAAAVPMEPDSFETTTAFDALDRPVELHHPDNSTIRSHFNEASLLERVEINLRGEQENGDPVWTEFVSDIDYNAKGQRTNVAYGNNTATRYEYDPLTFQLIRLITQRNNNVAFPDDCPEQPTPGWPGCNLQNLTYTYDPAGNVTHLRDDAQQIVYFRNRRVEPSAEYTYDASYRLIEANGREHLGQVGGTPITHSYNDVPRIGVLLSTSDGNAMGRYLERYLYDTAGNVSEMAHVGTDPANPGWTRTYLYDELSQLEPLRRSNRLTSTTVGALPTETYSTGGNGYDPHGNMLRLPQLQEIQWDFKDQMRMSRRQRINASDEDGIAHEGERTWYVYDASGQRVRKVTELAGGQLRDQRIYLDGFEIYRRGGGNPLVRETLHLMDNQQRLAMIETRTSGNEPGVPERLIRFQYDNHVGSACLELDHEAQIISYEEYTPFGSTSYQAVRSQTETPKRYRYGGKERDEESGLNYHNARYCVTWLARWLNPDPLGIKDGLNVYVYSRNNPIRFSDPTGTECNERDISTCPGGSPPPPPQTTGTLLESADANGGGEPRNPPPDPPPARPRTLEQLQMDWIQAIGESSRNFQLRGGLLSPEYRADSYPVTGTDQIGSSLGRAFKVVWGEHPQLQSDTKAFGLGLLRQNIPALVSFGVLGLMGTAGAAAEGQWQPASILSGLPSTLVPEIPFDLASGPANPGDMFFRQGVFQFRESTTIGQNEGENPVGLFPTLQFRGGFLNRDLTVTTGVNARYLPDLRQIRLQESFGVDQNLVRFNIGPYDASLQLSGRLNLYQQIDTRPEVQATPLAPEGTFGLQFRITEPPARPRPTQRDELSR